MNAPAISILSDEQKQSIRGAALGLLEQTGTVVGDPTTLDILAGAGARMEGEGRVHVPAELADECLGRAPDTVVIYDREGCEKLILGGRNVHFGVHGDSPTILDPATGKRRNFAVRDAEQVAALCDFLPNIDFVSQNGFAEDVQDPRIIPAIVVRHMLEYTSKPLGFGCYDTDSLEMVMDIAEVVAGSAEALRAKPFLYHYSEPTSPLVHSAPSLRRLRMAVERGVPLVYTPMPMAGATAPASLAGVVTQGLAETLFGVVVAQLISPGAPCIAGGIPTIMDMRSTICSYGAPEMHVMVGALTEMVHYCNLPMFGTAGCTDARTVDQQAAVETALSCQNALLTGGNLVHDVGLIDHAETVSPEMMVMTDEVIGMLRRYAGGVPVSEDTLALDVIDTTGPGAHFLETEHTLRHFRDNWQPYLFDRSMSGETAPAGTFEERLRTRTVTIMETHEPKRLPADKIRELDKIEKRLIS